MALERLQLESVIFFLVFIVLFVPGPTKVMSDSATEVKPTQPGLRNTATDPPWMSRPGMVFHMLDIQRDQFKTALRRKNGKIDTRIVR